MEVKIENELLGQSFSENRVLIGIIQESKLSPVTFIMELH